MRMMERLSVVVDWYCRLPELNMIRSMRSAEGSVVSHIEMRRSDA